MPEKPPSLRERQAQLTRDEILNAARRLFAERGYTRTSVRDIAEAAGVSAQTVYDSIGSKQALVARLNDLIDAEAGIAAIAGAAARSGDPARSPRTSARITRSILEHCGDIVHALVTGAAAEPDLAVALAEGQRRHVEGARPDRRTARAAGRARRLTSAPRPPSTRSPRSPTSASPCCCASSYGWSLDRVETWIGAASRALLLRPSPSS